MRPVKKITIISSPNAQWVTDEIVRWSKLGYSLGQFAFAVGAKDVRYFAHSMVLYEEPEAPPPDEVTSQCDGSESCRCG